MPACSPPPEVIEYLGSLSLLAALIFYFAKAGGMQKQKHYQAWHVTNTMQRKNESGGRVEALAELNQGGVLFLRRADASVAEFTSVSLRRFRSERRQSLRPDLRYADLTRSRWPKLKSGEAVNIYGIRHAPQRFSERAQAHGAKSGASEE